MARLVKRLNFRFNSVRIGPSRCFRYNIVRRSLSSCTASSAAVGARGSSGGATGSSSSTRRLRLIPSGNWLGGLCISLMRLSKNASRCSAVAPTRATRFSFVGPNHALTSRGSDAKGPSTTARRSTGSVGERLSSIARTVVLDVSVTAAHQPSSDGI